MRLALLLHAAAATYREDLCERDTKLKTDATSKKVALVLRGEAFRGLSYGISPSVGRFRRGKTAFSCTAVSHRIQRALSASHVAHLVAPLEAAGLEVDVYLATYGCGGVTSDKEAAIALRHLSKWYERNSTRTRVKRAEALDRAGATQSTPVNVAMGWLRDGWPAGGYRSVLIWRFDMPALAPMGRRQADPGGEAAECRPSVGRACPSVGLPPKAPRAECDPALDTNSSAKRRPMNCWCPPYDACHSKGGYDEYASRLDEAYYKYEDDWAFSFPGRLARCAVPVFETDCLNMKRPIMSHECNFRLARTGPVLSTDPKRWTVYRSDYNSPGGDTCRLLRDRFDGPPCPADERAGRSVACLQYAHVLRVKTADEVKVKELGKRPVWNQFKCDDFAAEVSEAASWWRGHSTQQVRGYDLGEFQRRRG